MCELKSKKNGKLLVSFSNCQKGFQRGVVIRENTFLNLVSSAPSGRSQVPSGDACRKKGRLVSGGHATSYEHFFLFGDFREGGITCAGSAPNIETGVQKNGGGKRLGVSISGKGFEESQMREKSQGEQKV